MKIKFEKTITTKKNKYLFFENKIELLNFPLEVS